MFIQQITLVLTSSCWPSKQRGCAKRPGGRTVAPEANGGSSSEAGGQSTNVGGWRRRNGRQWQKTGSRTNLWNVLFTQLSSGYVEPVCINKQRTRIDGLNLCNIKLYFWFVTLRSYLCTVCVYGYYTCKFALLDKLDVQWKLIFDNYVIKRKKDACNYVHKLDRSQEYI